jgi:hypothetical protein
MNRKNKALLMVANLFLITILFDYAAAEKAFTSPPAAIKAQMLEEYGKLPISFEANLGQSDEQVKFLARGSGYSLFLTPTEALLVLKQRSVGPPNQTVLRMQLVGANPAPQIAGAEELPGKANYFIGKDPKQWRTNIPTYTKVKYQDIYPGVDVVYYGNQRQLEYDLVIAPGVNPNQIQLAFQGADDIKLDPHGDLILHLQGGEVRLLTPHVYQVADGKHQTIGARYVLLASEQERSSSLHRSSISVHHVGIQVAAYDAAKPLIIDPVLSYSTYLGGSGGEGPGNVQMGITVDAAGNAYVTGQTSSVNFPLANPLQPALGSGFGNAFVAKLNAAGSTLIWSTYLGGNVLDHGHGIALDASGNVYVVGDTRSSNFPTTLGAFQTVCGGCSGTIGDIFVAKLNPTGSALLYSTFLGGSNNEEGDGIVVDSAGNVYVSGGTDSPFPTTSGAIQPGFGGFTDGIVAKLNPAGGGSADLVYSTFLGGSGREIARGIVLDSSGNVYVAGFTESTNFPTTPGAFRTTCPTCGFINADAFVVKLNASGSALLYSTYLGSSGHDDGRSIALDASGAAYVTGRAAASNFPTTPGAFQTTFGGSGDAFVTKLNASGAALVYSTFLGGSGDDTGTGIVLDSANNASITGLTSSTNFPTTSGAIQTTFGGGPYDAFVTKLNASGSALAYSTYLGGNGGISEIGWGITVDGADSAYVIGITDSNNFPTTPGAFQTAFGGGSHDAFVAKIAFNQPPTADAGSDQTVECTNSGGAGVTLDGTGSSDPDGDTLSYTWTDALNNVIATGPTPTVTLAVGSYTLTLTVDDGKGGTASDTVQVTVVDTTPPSIGTVSASPNVLWPPNHRMVPVSVAAAVLDACDAGASCQVLSVTSNEPVNGRGDGNTAPDWAITGPLTVDLRAERSGKGNGRVYTITVQCTDASGNSATKTVTVNVPKSQGK